MDEQTQPVNPTDDQQVTTPIEGEETKLSEEMPEVAGNEAGTKGDASEETAPEATSDEAAN